MNQLPAEVLLVIFQYLHRQEMDMRLFILDNERPKDSLGQMRLVCRSWYSAATATFFERVQLFTEVDIRKFCSLVQEAGYVRPLVRHLVITSRVHTQMPNSLRRRLAGMINLLQDVRVMDITCPLTFYGGQEEDVQRIGGVDLLMVPRPFVLPIASGKHSNLTSLTIHSDVINFNTFPFLLTHAFPLLEHLALDGFWLRHDVSPLTAPLFRLRHFEFCRGIEVWRLDSWLMACPKLEQVTLRGSDISSSPLSPPLELFAKGNVTTLAVLETSYFGDRDTLSFKWIDDCLTVEDLIIDASVVTRLSSPLHLPRRNVTLDYGKLDEITPFATLVKLFPAESHEMRFRCRHHPLYEHLESQDRPPCRYSLEYDICDCSGVQIYAKVTKTMTKLTQVHLHSSLNLL